MRKYLAVTVIIFILAMPCIVAADDNGSGVTSTLVLKTTSTTGNYPVKYPATRSPEITVMKVEIEPGAETSWHSHPVPLYAYVLEGDLTVEVTGGNTYHFAAGDAIVEVVHIFHNGKNIGTKPVVLIAFYTGEVGQQNVVKTPPDN
jgi:quercetin dioxygenase-like cupin family protein